MSSGHNLKMSAIKGLCWLSAGAAGTIISYFTSERVLASWTTNYDVPAWSRWDDNWDHRSPKSLVHPKKYHSSPPDGLTHDKKKEGSGDTELKFENIKATATRHIVLIRHGQYNLEGRNDDERALTALGKRQALYTGQRLKHLNVPISKVVKSTMKRAQQTADIIMEQLKMIQYDVVNCDMLREGAPVPPEPPLGGWKQENHQFFVDGARIEAAFRKYFYRAEPNQKEDSYTLLICHANVIRYFVCRGLQFPAEAWLRFSLNHGSITWMSITPNGRVILRCMGESGHMPPEALTTY